jgi:hypothetical protein
VSGSLDDHLIAMATLVSEVKRSVSSLVVGAGNETAAEPKHGISLVRLLLVACCSARGNQTTSQRYGTLPHYLACILIWLEGVPAQRHLASFYVGGDVEAGSQVWLIT